MGYNIYATMDKSMNVGIIFVGTSKYADFFEGFKKAVDKYFLNDCKKSFFVFTDQPENKLFAEDNIKVTKIEHHGWPWVTLHRFKYMNMVSKDLIEQDYVFFIDADLWPCSNITKEDIIEHDYPLIGVQHPGFLGKVGTFELDTRSTANIFDGKYDLSKYRQGCFWGGKSSWIVSMIKELEKNVDTDSEKNITAVWHDESHMNKYFVKNNQFVYTLHPGFATPQEGYQHIKDNYETKMVHLHKDLDEFPRFARGEL